MRTTQRNRFTPLGISLLLGVFVVIAVVILAASRGFTIPRIQGTSVPSGIQAVIPVAKPKPQKVVIGFVGDMMMHSKQIQSGKITTPDQGSDEYNFDSFFTDITPVTQAPDVMIANLETPVAPSRPLGQYPNFNAPLEILSALKNAGFDMLTLANNHTLDRGVSGAIETRQNVIDSGMIPIGVQTDPVQWYQPMMQTVRGINIAYISATIHLNGYTLPEDKQYLVNILEKEKVITAIESAKTQKSDIIVVLPHWGVEYARQQSPEQIEWAHAWIDAGADLVIGSHPHVVQPTEVYTSPSGRVGFIAYSLGNFLSNQQDMYTDLEGMVTVTLQKNPDTGIVSVMDHTFVPLYRERKTGDSGKTEYRVLTLLDALKRIDTYSETAKERVRKYAKEYQDTVIPN